MDRTPILPAHLEDTVAAIAEVHAAHYRGAGAMQRAVTAVTTAFARPAFVFAITAVSAGWLVLNLALIAAGRPAPDPPPFVYFFGMTSLACLYLTAFILITHRHDDDLATHREQLTLELAIQGERKSAKIIALLETLRLNDPHQSDAPDPVADALSIPADPEAVLDAIRSAHAVLE